MTTSSRLSTGSSPGIRRVGSQEQPLYWTDDIPVCYLSGVGFSTNQLYRDDGFRREEHEFEDQSFHFKVENDLYLYGVFDGHDGSKVANFAAQRLPAEIVLGQLDGRMDKEDVVRSVLHQALTAVDKSYMDSISHLLAERYNLQEQLPEGMQSYEAYQQFPELFKRLESIEAEIGGGSTAVVALIVKRKLYIANVGCCRALLCKTDSDGILRVFQLTTDHCLGNEEELQRLSDLNLDTAKICAGGQLGSHPYTRTIGDYGVKGGYKDIEILRSAKSDPVIADPDIHSEIDIDDSSSFLLLMTDGLYKSLEDATGTDHVNREIASMVATEFAIQSTLNGVAQAVVDKVVRIHHDTFMTCTDHRKQLCQMRDDMTLLVRNFSYPLPNSISSPSINTSTAPVSIPFPTMRMTQPLSVIIPPGSDLSQVQAPSNMLQTATNPSGFSTVTGTLYSTQSYTSSNDSTQSGDTPQLFTPKSQDKNPIPLDEDGRIEAYVDFSDFYEAMAKLSETEKETFSSETELQPAYETIPEETGHSDSEVGVQLQS